MSQEQPSIADARPVTILPQPTAFQRFMAMAPVMMALLTMIAGGLAGYATTAVRLASYDWRDQQSAADRQEMHTQLRDHEGQIQSMRADLVEIKTILRLLSNRLGVQTPQKGDLP